MDRKQQQMTPEAAAAAAASGCHSPGQRSHSSPAVVLQRAAGSVAVQGSLDRDDDNQTDRQRSRQ